jgi:hypothetical protein
MEIHQPTSTNLNQVPNASRVLRTRLQTNFDRHLSNGHIDNNQYKIALELRIVGICFDDASLVQDTKAGKI